MKNVVKLRLMEAKSADPIANITEAAINDFMSLFKTYDSDKLKEFFGVDMANFDIKIKQRKLDRREIIFDFPTSWKFTPAKLEILREFFDNNELSTYGRVRFANSAEETEIRRHRDITGNAHAAIVYSPVIVNNTKIPNNYPQGRQPFDTHLFTIKFPLKQDKQTSFKEGAKVLFVNYMIARQLPHLKHAIHDEQSYDAFLYWAELQKDKPTRGMTVKDFNAIMAYLIAAKFNKDNPEKFNELMNYVEQYHTSCDMIYTLAQTTSSYVTRDDSESGMLRSFKKAAAEDGPSVGKKAHPADLVMVGSIFNSMSCTISDNEKQDQICCAISLKESVARWGKSTSAVVKLPAEFKDKGINVQDTTLDKIRDKFLYDEIDNLIAGLEDDNYRKGKTDRELFEHLCNKFYISFPTSSKYTDANLEKTKITCRYIKNIDLLNAEATSLKTLSSKAISNLFFAAVITSLGPTTVKNKEFIAYMINSSLQLGSCPYYVAKDGEEGLIPITSSQVLTSDNIDVIDVEYSKAGDIKVTKAIISMKFSKGNKLQMPTSKHNNKLELDIRQGGRGKKNTALEFK